MRFLSVCSGIEAASCALEPLGFTPVGFAEIDKAASRVLAHHYGSNMPGEPLSRNGVPNYGDFTLIDPKSLGRVDWLIGGTPCQSFSIAGKRLSLADARGNLTLSYAVLAHELVRHNGLRGCLWENVPGCLNTPDNAFGCFLGALVGRDDALLPEPKPRDGISTDFWRWRKAGRFPVLDDDGIETGEFVSSEAGHVCSWPDAGMVAGPRARLAWRILDAQHHRLAQRRRRVFVVVGFRNRVDPSAILLEPKSLRRDPSQGRKAREGIARPLASSPRGGSGYRNDADTAENLIVGGSLGTQAAPALARCDATREGSSQDYETTTMIAETVGALSSNGGTERKHGYGMGQQDYEAGYAIPCAFDARQSDVCVYGDRAAPLDTDGFSQAVAFKASHFTRDKDGAPSEVAPPLSADADKGDQDTLVLAFQDRSRGDDGRGYDRPPPVSEGVCGTLETVKPWAVAFDTTQITSATNRCNPQIGDPCHPLAAGAHPPALAIDLRNGTVDDAAMSVQSDVVGTLTSNGDAHSGFKDEADLVAVAFDMRGREGGAQFEGPHDTANIRAASGGSSRSYVAQQWAVRRLTPRECERLQGFPDDYTLIPDEDGKGQADGARYRQLGNSFAVSVISWLGKRILADAASRNESAA